MLSIKDPMYSVGNDMKRRAYSYDLYGVMLNLIELVLIKAVTEHFGYLF